MHAIYPGPATRRAPFSPRARCNSALEHRLRSQYSRRPLKSTQKKTANVKADCKANLPGPQVRSQRVQKLSEFDCVHHSRRGFFGFLNTLAQLLLNALKLTEQTIFAASKKTPHQSVRLEKKPETFTSGATE
ncbi:hypothetical protein [Pseudomonas yamanorum]|uniref:hypothetical protein n=1 Tax=Pseudomonas yamanorum TaxID=515393 RepID=UPI002ED11A50|nr:hypothetical protein VYI69_06080 [Pseudomonas yamanorum]